MAHMEDFHDAAGAGERARVADRPAARPLVVDLDETLVRTDLLVESSFAYLAGDPLRIVAAGRALSQGRAQLKAEIARRTPLDVASLPYDPEVLKLIGEARGAGRPVYLASASDERYVGAIADHLGLFDGWFASNGVRNLSARAKAELLVERFGSRGFDYVGNGRADLPVWAAAGGAVAVGADARVVAELKAIDPGARIIPEQRGGYKVWLRLLRVHQWVKNGLVFVPVLAAHLFNVKAFAAACVAAVAFSMVASAIYIVNDLVDLESDRNHRSKKNRPLAAGTAPIWQALMVAMALPVGAFALALLLPPAFAVVLAAYLATTTAYSFWLKRKMMADIVALASLYTLRVIGGAVAVSTVPSEWILAFSMLIFTSLALLKRYVELGARLDGAMPDPTNRNYKKGDLPVIGALSAAAGFNAVTVFALYISSPTVNRMYTHPQALWLVCPILLYWIGRAIILAERRLIHDDPILFALKDRVSQLAFLALVVVIIAAV